MAIEVQETLYLDWNATDLNSSYSKSELSVKEVVACVMEYSKRQEPSKSPYLDIPFRHHYLHDIESLWWIAIWALFKTRPKSLSQFKQRESMEYIFPHSLNNTGLRLSFFINEAINERELEPLPEVFQESIKSVGLVRHLLLAFYARFQKLQFQWRSTDESEQLDPIYEAVLAAFQVAAENAAKDLEMIPTLPPGQGASE